MGVFPIWMETEESQYVAHNPSVQAVLRKNAYVHDADERTRQLNCTKCGKRIEVIHLTEPHIVLECDCRRYLAATLHSYPMTQPRRFWRPRRKCEDSKC